LGSNHWPATLETTLGLPYPPLGRTPCEETLWKITLVRLHQRYLQAPKAAFKYFFIKRNQNKIGNFVFVF